AEQVRADLGKHRPHDVRLSVVPPMADVLTTGAELVDVRGLPLVMLPGRRRPAGLAWAAKRAFDYVAAIAGLVLVAPVFLATAVAIKLDSPGPVFFRQKRVGRNGKVFEIWKFRSMVVDAEDRLPDVIDLNEASGPYFKIAADPRVTRVGRVLRRTCIAKLTQLLNVLAGAMILVGPR